MTRLATLTRASVLTLTGLLGACGGSGSGGGGGSSGNPPPPPVSYQVGGSITGLTTAGLVLANGADTVSPASGATSFTFGTALSSGASYTVSVQTQPTNATCAVSNGTGTATAMVTSVNGVVTIRFFLLTGSANLLLMQRVSESLAGRARYLTLWPMTRREQLGLGACGVWETFFSRTRDTWIEVVSAQTAPREPWQNLAVRGGYPTAALLHSGQSADSDRHEIFTGYTQTYLERDLRDLAAIDNLYDFQRLMRAACLRLGSVINQVELARDTGLPRTTVQRYLNLLEVSYQLVRLEPYAVNRTKRLIKSPKLYWSDTGLALHLAQQSTPTGPHLENIVCTDLLAWRETDAARPAILYWRTSTGEEVDFVIEREGKLLPIEVKATENPGYNDTKGLRSFLEEYGDHVPGGLLLHSGEKTYWISERVLAAPWWKVL